jgi:hypothetical protein
LVKSPLLLILFALLPSLDRVTVALVFTAVDILAALFLAKIAEHKLERTNKSWVVSAV